MMAINIDMEGGHTFYLKVPRRLEGVTGSNIALHSKNFKANQFYQVFLADKGPKPQTNNITIKSNWFLRIGS